MTLRFLVVMFVLSAAPGAQAYCRLTTAMPKPELACAEEGVPLTWRRSCISYSLVQRQSTSLDFDRIRDVTDLSFSAWEAVGCQGGPVGLELGQTEGLGECDEPEYNPSMPNANTIMFVEDWRERELPPDAFGLTLVWHNPDTGEIYDADMQINENLGELAICGAVCSGNVVDLQNVITHEAGHFLGLGHSSDPNATMSARAMVGETKKRQLSEDDRAGLCSIYGDDPEPVCAPSDFFPDNGFSPACWADVDATRNSGLCAASVLGGRTIAVWPALAVPLALIALRRRRRRTTPRV
jgi:hypothetical protein